jgi:hypothetical protein
MGASRIMAACASSPSGRSLDGPSYEPSAQRWIAGYAREALQVAELAERWKAWLRGEPAKI